MDRLARLAPLSGLVAALTFAAGSAVWAFEQPDRDAGTEEIVAFYEETSIEILVGGSISIVAIAFFVWFGAVLRERLAAAEGRRRTGLPLTAFAGAILAAAVGFGAETINMAGAWSAEDGQLNGDTAQIYFDVSYALGAPAAGVAFAMVAIPTALIALLSGRIARPWAAWLALLLGLATLSPLMWTPAFSVLSAVALVMLGGLSLRLYRDDG
jgi:hypothetical protein